jgi:CRP/FNR family transcriptional regulator, polysaccharide utilization system transcription regulator
MAEAQTLCPDCQYKSACFEQLNVEELRFADKSKVQIRYKKGETIIKQGSFVTHVLYVKQGLVKIYKEHSKEANLIYDILPSGTLVGLSNLYYSETFQFSVAALAESAICSIDREVLEKLITDNGAFARSVMESINTELQHLRNKMVSLTHKQTRGKLADSLLYLAENVFLTNTFSSKLSRNDLAEFSGMSMMSVVRTLQEFIKRGYLEEREGKINILDMEALEQISQETF